MKPTLFIVGGSSTALEIRETVDQFFKDKYFAVYNVISCLLYTSDAADE